MIRWSPEIHEIIKRKFQKVEERELKMIKKGINLNLTQFIVRYAKINVNSIKIKVRMVRSSMVSVT